MTGEGMTWLEMIPDDTFRVIAAMYFPDGTHDPERKQYPVTCHPVRNKQSPPAALPVTGGFVRLRSVSQTTGAPAKAAPYSMEQSARVSAAMLSEPVSVIILGAACRKIVILSWSELVVPLCCFDKPVNDPMDRMFTLDGRLNSKNAVRV